MSARTTPRPLAGIVLRTQPDSRLVSLFREGHACAFDEIVRRYRPALVGFAAGIVPRHQAEDVVQESLVRAHAALAGENEIEVRPWLYTIVRNRALNAVRDARHHEHLSEDYDGVPQPPDVFNRREEVKGLVSRLKGLPDQQREAIVKRELEGRSHEEIALAIGATPGAVRGLIFRAREGLRAVGGFVIPSTLLESAVSSPGTTGAIGGVAAGGGASLLLKAGVAATVGVIAVGSGIALHRGSRHGGTTAVASEPHGAGHALGGKHGRTATVHESADVFRPAKAGVSRDSSGSGDSHGGSSSGGPGPSAPSQSSGEGSSGSSTSTGSSGDGGGGSSGGSHGGSSGPGSGSGSDDGGGSGDDGGTSGSGSDDGDPHGGGGTSGGGDGGDTTGTGDTSGSDSGGDDEGSSGGGSDDGLTSPPTDG